MTTPTVRQHRRSLISIDGVTTYEITSSIVDPGDLPHPELFVVSIADPLDARSDILARIATPADLRRSDPAAPIYVRVDSADTTRIGTDLFARIASVNDITTLPRDRVIAVRRGFTEYLSSVVAHRFTNLQTADAAYRQIVSRLSTLVTNWRQAQDSFNTTPYEDFTLPQGAFSVGAVRVATYATAKASRTAAEAARDAAQAAYDAAIANCASERAIHALLAADVLFLERAKQRVTAITETAVGSLALTGGTTLTAPGTYTITTTPASLARAFALDGSDAESYEALLASKRAQLLTYDALVSACANNTAELSARLREAQNTVDATRAAENTALADVLSVCPTFSPGSVP